LLSDLKKTYIFQVTAPTAYGSSITRILRIRIIKCRVIAMIARQSMFTNEGKPVKVKQVSEELGMRYVLEGSVPLSGEKVRIEFIKINPTFSLEQFAKILPFRDTSQIERMTDALRKAGLKGRAV